MKFLRATFLIKLKFPLLINVNEHPGDVIRNNDRVRTPPSQARKEEDRNVLLLEQLLHVVLS